jgi:glycosyltransferase involved in cell wall biosynthesis
MKILILSTSMNNNPSIGKTGGEIYFCEIYRFFSKTKQCQFLSMRTAPILFQKNFFLCNLWFLWKIYSYKPDVILEECFLPHNLFVCNWIIKLFSSKKTFCLYQALLDYDHNLYKGKIRLLLSKIIFKFFIHSINISIANSHYLKNRLISWGIPRNKIEVISPTGQKNILNHKNLKISQQINNNIIIICIGKIRPIKGQLNLLKAISRIKQNNIFIHFIGEIYDQNYYQEIKELTSLNNLQKRVFFEGCLGYAKIIHFYKKANLFVLPSLYEAYGMVLHEAMRFGLPIIASNVGGIPEIIEHNKTGLLTEKNNVQELKSSIERLLNISCLRKRLCSNAYLKSFEFNSWEQIMEKYQLLLNRK